MSEYHKIQSVYLRNPETRHKNFLIGQWSMSEFEYLANNQWTFTEKIDGTNVRIYWDHEAKKVSFNGRTKDAQMSTFLFSSLSELFPAETFNTFYPDQSMALYGEGYGAKIQKGGGDYIPDGVGFILFDVFIGMWLQRQSVLDIASNLGIPFAPILGQGTLYDAIDICKNGFKSQLKQSAPEGLVCRPIVELLTRRGDRIITKIKLKDFI